MKKNGVYKILNNINGKIYIGSSSYLQRRLTEHKRLLKQSNHPNKKLQYSVNKHGIENFIFEIIEECSIDSLLEREQYYIDYYKEVELYNYSKSAEAPARGYKHTKEAIEKIRKSSKERIFPPKTKEQRENISKSKKGTVPWNKKIHPICQCLICGKNFSVKPHKIKDGKGKYCSKKCTYKSFKNKRSSPRTEFKKGIIPWNKRVNGFGK